MSFLLKYEQIKTKQNKSNFFLFLINFKSINTPTPKLRIPDIIMKKRDGHELTKEEIQFFIQAICDNNNNISIQESQIGKLKIILNIVLSY